MNGKSLITLAFASVLILVLATGAAAQKATILQMCLPGAPTIHYGDEAELAGFTDPDDRRTYPWGREDAELIGFFKDAIALHKEFTALKTGSFAMLSANQYGLFAFGRWDRASRVVAAINNYKEEREIEIALGALGMAEGESLELVLSADRDSHGRPGTAYIVSKGAVTVSVPAFGGVVLASRKGSGEPEAAVTTRPFLVSASPAAGSAKASPDAAIVLRFSEPMEQRGIAADFSIDPAVKGRFVWNGNSVSFLPAAPLAPGPYRVSLSGSLRALRGNFSLSTPASWSFTVK